MKYIRQFLVILSLSLAGEILNFIIPFSIPSSIYGMVLMFILLCTGIMKVKHIKETSNFLIDIMPLLFVPAAVGIVSQFDQLRQFGAQLVIITFITTISTMVVTGLTSQAIIRFKKRRDKNGSID